jgi:Na+/H+ antiporter NhaD/arsenite permease-like protein
METLVWNTDMLVSGLILILTFIGIFTEGVHGFHRAKFALGGAGAMVIAGQYFGFYNPELAVEAIDWNVIFLLGAMMTIVAIMIPTGGFQFLAYKIADLSKGKLFVLLVMMGTMVTVLSLLLDNVTTVVIFGPLIILICQALQVSPIPYLLAAALLSDTGGVATLVGDPPNLMIGSAAGIDFNTFLYHMGGIVFCAWIGTLLFLKVLFKEELSATPAKPDFSQVEKIRDPHTWKASLWVLGVMVIGFMTHNALHWEPWFVAGTGLTILVFIGKDVDMDEHFADVELSLLMFFMALFIIVGGVEHSNSADVGGRNSVCIHRQHPVHCGNDPDHPGHGNAGHQCQSALVGTGSRCGHGRQRQSSGFDCKRLHCDHFREAGQRYRQSQNGHHTRPVAAQGFPCDASDPGYLFRHHDGVLPFLR